MCYTLIQIPVDLMSVPPLLTGPQLHVGGSCSSKGTIVEADYSKANSTAQRRSDSREGHLGAPGTNSAASKNRHASDQSQVGRTHFPCVLLQCVLSVTYPVTVTYPCSQMQADRMPSEDLLAENTRLRTQLQRMVHEVESRKFAGATEGPQGQNSARQYAEDLEIQLEHVECLKGDLELELTKTKAELKQIQLCMQVHVLVFSHENVGY